MKKVLVFIGIMMLLLLTIIIFKPNYNYHYKVVSSSKAKNIRLLFGSPTYTNTYEKDFFIDVYDFSANKYVFTYSKKDSLLVSKWKEY